MPARLASLYGQRFSREQAQDYQLTLQGPPGPEFSSGIHRILIFRQLSRG